MTISRSLHIIDILIFQESHYKSKTGEINFNMFYFLYPGMAQILSACVIDIFSMINETVYVLSPLGSSIFIGNNLLCLNSL